MLSKTFYPKQDNEWTTTHAIYFALLFNAFILASLIALLTSRTTARAVREE